MHARGLRNRRDQEREERAAEQSKEDPRCAVRYAASNQPARIPTRIPFHVEPITMPTIPGAVSGAEISALSPSKIPERPRARDRPLACSSFQSLLTLYYATASIPVPHIIAATHPLVAEGLELGRVECAAGGYYWTALLKAMVAAPLSRPETRRDNEVAPRNMVDTVQ